MNRITPRLATGLALASLLLAGCERLGIPDPVKTEAQAEADGKAIGSACRHAGRAIEDCFTLYPTAQRAAIFTGWKEMNDYMAENKMESVPPQLPPPAPPAPPKPASKKKPKADSDENDNADKGDEPATEPDKSDDAAASADSPRKRRSGH